VKTNIHFWYLAKLFLEWELCQTEVVEKIKAHICCSITFFSSSLRKSCRVWYNVERYGRPGQATVDRHYGAFALHAGYVRLQTHIQNVNCLLLFHYNNVYTIAPQCNAERTLPVLLRVFLVLEQQEIAFYTSVSSKAIWYLQVRVYIMLTIWRNNSARFSVFSFASRTCT
jgi:hypothetical protein